MGRGNYRLWSIILVASIAWSAIMELLIVHQYNSNQNRAQKMLVGQRTKTSSASTVPSTLQEQESHPSNNSSSSSSTTITSSLWDSIALLGKTFEIEKEALEEEDEDPGDGSVVVLVDEMNRHRDGPQVDTPRTSTPTSLFPTPNYDGIVKIALLPQEVPEKRRKAVAKHLLYDGIQQSPRLEFTNKHDVGSNHVMWVVDLLAAREMYDDWCTSIHEQIIQTQQLRKQGHRVLQWPIVLMDNQDYPVFGNCVKIGAAVGDFNVQYSYRSSVENRSFVHSNSSSSLSSTPSHSWVDVGHLLNTSTLPSKYRYQHRPIGVRTDTVESVASLFQDEYNLSLCDAIEDAAYRSVDVSYFWEFTNYTRRDAILRDTVYQLLQDVQQQPHNNWTMIVGLRGERAGQGRNKVSSSYIEAMIQSKIVVVTQRDNWEDHYRLFEAIVSGALVFTDTMLSLPTGLKDGESVVEYNSPDDLRSKLEYYLQHEKERIQIARQGRFIAMSRHRSWHQMEEMVFGVPVTTCSATTAGSRCPYVVHANQSMEDCASEKVAYSSVV